MKELLLANRSFLYALIARGYAEEIDDDFARIFTSDHAREEVCLVETAESASIVSLFDELAALLARDGAVQAARREYVRLFIGPTTLRADPWETVQLTGKRALFQPGVLDVRDAYRQAGFEPVRVREVPDDFIGIELDFMAKLAARACDEFEAGETAWLDGAGNPAWPAGAGNLAWCAGAGETAWLETLRQSCDFLQNHLLKWVNLLAGSIEKEYGDIFYAKLTRFASLVAARDERVLETFFEDGD